MIQKCMERRVLALLLAAGTVSAAVLLLSFGVVTLGDRTSAHEDPAGCDTNGLNSTLQAVPAGVRQHGDTLTYTTTFTNVAPGACNLTDVDAALTLPSGAVLSLLSNETLAAGDSIACPGDARCVAPGPYQYVIAHDDETGPGTGCPPVPSGPALPRRVTAYVEVDAILHSVEADDTASDCKSISRTVIHTPAVRTQVHDSAHRDITGGTVALGTTVHDKAIVSDPFGFGTPAGTVDFRRFSTRDCSGPSSDENDVPLVAGAAESTPFTPPVGDLSYRVHYDGDLNYTPADGPCEPLTISSGLPKPDLLCTKELKPGQPAPVRGGDLSYIIRCRNAGNASTPGGVEVQLRDTLPPGTTFRYYTANAGICSWSPPYVSCGRSVMSPGVEWWVEIRIKLPSTGGTIVNTVTIDPFDRITESNETNNTTTLATAIP